MATEDALIHFKTNAWKGEQMVAGYAQRMHENRGTNRLKNQVEVSLCASGVVGRKIIDVGIGTGRGSLPLARAGFDVTGVDISQAMLDQCRREAGETPIDLRAGDLTSLPAGDEEFDSLISLNVAVHFPNWRGALRDWARVVRPGGRVIFDVHSLDHLQAVAAFRGCAPEDLLTEQQRNDPGWYMLRVKARDIAAAARDCGLSVVKLVPYAAVLGGGNVNYWLLDSRLHGYLGDRALSWMSVDERLFAFGLFIEESIVAKLSTHATGRFMVVLQKARDDVRTSQVVQYHDAVAQAFAQRASLQSLRDVVGPAVDEWAAPLQMHLQYPLNRTLLAMALSSPAADMLGRLVNDLVGPKIADELYDAHRRQKVDESVHGMVSTWYKTLAEPKLFEYNGVDLGPSFEYDLMRELLDVEFFDGKAGTR